MPLTLGVLAETASGERRLSVVPDVVKKYLGLGVQVVMQKGQEKYYHPVGFLDEKKICHAYKVADMIISRAGSGSIFEIAAVGKPSILVPLPGASFNHQAKNAYIYSDTGAAMVFEQQSLTPNFFIDESLCSGL